MCEDKSKDCPNWASEGECDSNKDAMQTLCPQSCGLCHRLEQFYRVAIDGGASKEEL